jgi:hypothetical protein
VTFRKGFSGNPGGRKRADTMVVFDLKQAARRHCERALEVLAEALEHKDIRVRMVASSLLLERGYGKPEQRVDAAVTHKFAVVPEVMEEAEWLARKGQPAPKALPPPKTNGTSH